MAQVTRVQHASSVSTKLADNTDGDITAQDLREVITDLEDSVVWYDEIGAAAASNSYDDLDDLPTIPTNNNQLTNGAGYITDYTVTEEDVTAHEAALTITESQISDLGSYATAAQGALADSAVQPGDLATVATTGDYDDLSNKPTVPVASDVAYNSTSWNGNTDVPTKNAVRDQFVALDAAKANTSHTHAASAINSGTFANARIAQSNVTQHQAALSITESQISDLGDYVESDPTGVTGGDAITNMMSLTTSEYGAITPNATSLYFITDA